MVDVRLSSRAEIDLARVADYTIETFGVEQARRYRNELEACFREIVGHHPYPWQRCLYGAFVEGRIPEALDIPTGLGKTLCVLLFLLARVRNAALPTRVVYIVDRRAIVDQTADAIRAWIERIAELPCLASLLHESSAFPSHRPVQLGILRGGLADDGEWRIDPAKPAVVVGTVDMIGSRIMFSGYGDGRSRRPMHAGLLGHDTIAMLVVGHPVTARQASTRAIARAAVRVTSSGLKLVVVAVVRAATSATR